MLAQLVSLGDGPNLILDKPIVLFGRHAECDVQLNSRKVSRRHCCIAQLRDYLVIRDLGSTNGIRINGTRVAEGRLKGGDEVTIGNFRYQVLWEQPKPAPGAKKPSVVDHILEEADQPIPLEERDHSSPILHARPARPRSTGVAPKDPSSIIPPDLTLEPTTEPKPGTSSH